MLANAMLDYFAETVFRDRQRLGLVVRHDLAVSGLGEVRCAKLPKRKVMNGGGAASSGSVFGRFLPLWLGLFSSTCHRLRGRQQRIGPPCHSTPKLTTELDPVEVFFLPDPLEDVIDNNLPITTARP